MEKTDINTYQLEILLDKYSQELTVTFLERRGRSQMHKDNALDELRDVIKELTNREKELQAVVGIAKMLLRNNEILNTQIEVLKEKKQSKSQFVKRLKQDLEATQDKLIASESRFEETNSFLLKAEREILEINNENRLLRQRVNKLPSNLSQETNEQELHQMKRSFENQHKTLSKSLCSARKTENDLRSKVQDLEDSNIKLSLTNEKLTRELEHTRGSIRDLETEVNSLLNKSEEREMAIQKTNVNYVKALKKIRQLEEEVQILDIKSADQNRPQICVKRSLLTELAELGEDSHNITDQKIPCKFYKCAQTELVGSVGVSRKIEHPRKDPCEEFFILATQSVKMNSPYMDAICTIPTQAIYKKAIGLEVPFHRWYEWIENELNTIYIQMVYQKEFKNTD